MNNAQNSHSAAKNDFLIRNALENSNVVLIKDAAHNQNMKNLKNKANKNIAEQRMVWNIYKKQKCSFVRLERNNVMIRKKGMHEGN